MILLNIGTIKMGYRIENWALLLSGKDEWKAPECQTMHLVGNIFGRGGRFPDGKKIQTSAIEAYDKETGEVITFSGSRYILGEVHPKQEEAHPNSKERLVKVLTNLS